MKLEIWCVQSFNPSIKAVHAATVDWPTVPQTGDYIVIHDGWCSELVKSVHHNFEDRSCIIEIGPDFSGGYAEGPIVHPS